MPVPLLPSFTGSSGGFSVSERNFPLDSPLKMPYIIDDKSLPIKAAGNLSVC